MGSTTEARVFPRKERNVTIGTFVLMTCMTGTPLKVRKRQGPKLPCISRQSRHSLNTHTQNARQEQGVNHHGDIIHRLGSTAHGRGATVRDSAPLWKKGRGAAA